MLIVIDTQWKDHLLSIDHLKEGIGLRGYGQRDPLTEYKKEAFDLFQDMVERVKGAVVERLFKVQVVRDAPMELPTMTAWARTQEMRAVTLPGSAPADPRRLSIAASRPAPAPRTPTGVKIGRNDPCYCGSGKKYKKCHYLKQVMDEPQVPPVAATEDTGGRAEPRRPAGSPARIRPAILGAAPRRAVPGAAAVLPITADSLTQCPHCRAELHACRQCAHFDTARRFECAQAVARARRRQAPATTARGSRLMVTVERDTSAGAVRPDAALRRFGDLFKK